MKRASPKASGKPTAIATRATSTVPTSTAAIPILPSWGSQFDWVKKLSP